MVVCFVSADGFITHTCQFNNQITAKHDSISHTKSLNTRCFLKIVSKTSDAYGITLAYI